MVFEYSLHLHVSLRHATVVQIVKHGVPTYLDKE